MNYEDLSTEQKYAFAKFKEGHNLFITGPGGTGKTQLIKYLVRHMTDKHIPHQVCATTGCASVLLNCKATTIHSWSGIRLLRETPDQIIERIFRNGKLRKAWTSIQVLIVDEVSMMSCKVFEYLDVIGRAVRRAYSKPFGGIQLVFTGDFFQLPPVPDMSDERASMFCFQSEKWPHAFPMENCIELRTIFRQKDPVYKSILNEIRRGKLSPENAELLKRNVQRPYENANGLVPTKLFPIKNRVEHVNKTMYLKLAEDEIQFTAMPRMNYTYLDSMTPIPREIVEKCTALSATDKDREYDMLLTSSHMEKNIALKTGCVVMCTVNYDVENGICNGSQGVIVAFADYILPPTSRFDAHDAPKRMKVPVVKFTNGRQMNIVPVDKQSEEYPCLVIKQLPLCLAWAMTIHKIQGATLDMAEMDLGRTIFEYGQTYVALSRIQNLDGLYISDFHTCRIRANPDVIAFYDQFTEKTDEEMLAYIADAETRAATPGVGDLTFDAYVYKPTTPLPAPEPPTPNNTPHLAPSRAYKQSGVIVRKHS